MPKRPSDPKVAQIVNLYSELLASVPTVRQPFEHGPLTEEQIGQAAERMDQLGAEVKAARTAREAES